MDETVEARLLERNRRIIAMVVERAKRDFPDDIAIVGLTGSFTTGDHHEGSDLDLVIVNNSDRGWGIADTFILGDVGFDLYCTPWTSLEAKSRLEDAGVSTLTDMQVHYTARPEDLDRLRSLQRRARDLLSQPVGRASLDRARPHLAKARQALADAMLAGEPGPVRFAAANVVHHVVNALISINNTCITRGIKRYLEILLALEHLPRGVEALYMAVVDATTIEGLRAAARSLLAAVVELHEHLWQTLVQQPVPTYDNLRGTYEELWCNYLNKVLVSTAAGDRSYAFHAALGAQDYLDEMHGRFGTPSFDLLRDFDAGDLGRFRDAFLAATELYRAEYAKVGRDVKRYDSVDDLYADYMAQP